MLRTAILAAIVAFIVAHCVQVATPLRLVTDSIHFLSMAVSYEEGHGWHPPGPERPQPIGYAVLIVGLDKLGIASSGTLVATNIVFLLIGSWANFRLLRCVFPNLPGGDTTRLTVVLLTLASWVIIKHTPIALSDMTYFGLSALTALALNASWSGRTGGAYETVRGGRGRAIGLLVGFALFLVSFAVRTVGAAFLPALLLAAVGPDERLRRVATEQWRRNRNAVMLGACGCVVVGAVAAVLMVTRTKYGREAIEIYTQAGPIHVALNIARYRLSDLGYVILNINESSVPASLQFVVSITGAIGYLALLMGLWRTWRSFGPAMAYLGAYTAIFLIWPYSDPRFWIPVIPLSAALIVEGLRPLWNHRSVGLLAVVYVACFTALGAAAIAYTTRISLSGARFGSAFGDGETLKDSYLKALGLPHDESKVLPNVLELFERFEPRAWSK